MSPRARSAIVDAIRVGNLWSENELLTVAVSGGVDSVAMLDLLVRTQGLHKAKLSVGTVNHNVREESAADAAFVEALAGEYGLSCFRFDLNLGDDPSENEMRTGRYQALLGRPGKLATGHNADDQAETVMLNILRGTGLKGLAGIPRSRGRVVRPLLGMTREQILDYANNNSLHWREDPTNTTDRYLRNRIRSDLLPLMENLREGSGNGLGKLAELVSADNQLLELLASKDDKWDSQDRCWPTPWLRALPAPLARRCLMLRIYQAEHRHIDAVFKALICESGVVQLPHEQSVVVNAQKTSLITKKPNK